MNRIDTSIDGFKYAGVKLSERQMEDFYALNLQMQCHPEIPVFNIIMLLKVLNLLPPEMIDEIGDYQSDSYLNEDFKEWLQRRYGKREDALL